MIVIYDNYYSYYVCHASHKHITWLMEYPLDASSTPWQLAFYGCQLQFQLNAWIKYQ